MKTWLDGCSVLFRVRRVFCFLSTFGVAHSKRAAGDGEDESACRQSPWAALRGGLQLPLPMIPNEIQRAYLTQRVGASLLDLGVRSTQRRRSPGMLHPLGLPRQSASRAWKPFGNSSVRLSGQV